MPRIMEAGFVDETTFVDESGMHVAYFAVKNPGNYHPGAAHMLQAKDGYEPARAEHKHMFPHATLHNGEIVTSDGRVAMIGLKAEYFEFHQKQRELREAGRSPGHGNRKGETMTQEVVDKIANLGVPIRKTPSQTDPTVGEGGSTIAIEEVTPNDDVEGED